MDKQEVFQTGSIAPSIAASALCGVVEDRILGIEILNIKREIIKIIKVEKKIGVMDLSDRLQVSPRKIVLSITELEKEGLIKNV